MSYRVSAKNRKIKRFFLQLFSILKFEGFNINISLKIVIIGIGISIFGLFYNWFDSYDGVIKGNGFHKILGITGYILFFLNIKILFFIFGKNIKEVLKNFLYIFLKDSLLILIFCSFGLIITINAIFIILNLDSLKEGIILGRGIIFVIVGYVLGIIGGFINILTKTKTSISVDNNNVLENKVVAENDNKNNMTLPF